MAEKIGIRELFLRNFVAELISNSNPAPVQTAESEEISKPFAQQRIRMQNPRQFIQMSRIAPAPSSLRLAREIPSMQTPQKPLAQLQQQNMRLQTPRPKPTTQQLVSLLKLTPFIKDPVITEIECSGANEPLLVKKGGAVQQTQLKLTEEEIKKILSEFSEKTKIPIIEGTFKAAFDNLIMTAVISDILGPRFILQKKSPFAPLI